MKLLLVALMAASAQAICPNKCSGHGTCGAADSCVCYPNWTGSDCAGRKCAYGLSWVAAASGAALDVPAGGMLGGRHAYSECSSRGICERGSGECRCFEGYEGKGCRRTTCPNACSGHGRCVYNQDIAAQTVGENAYLAGYDGFGLDNFDSVKWDAKKTRQCMCDRGWEDVDCSKRMCPKGDDPLTNCDTKNQKDDVQLIMFFGHDEYDIINNDQYFTLTFTDMFNGNYTTTPIQLQAGHTSSNGALCNQGNPAVSSDACYYNTATGIEDALKALPNFAVPTVSVAYFNSTMYRFPIFANGQVPIRGTTDMANFDFDTGTTATTAATGTSVAAMTGFLVTFVDSATSGLQQTLDCYAGSQYDSDEPGAQPRFGLHGRAPATCAVYHVGEPTNNDNVAVKITAGIAVDGAAKYAEFGVEANVTLTNDKAAGTGTSLNADGTGGAALDNSVGYDYTWAPLADSVPYDSISTYKEHAVCSNRGNCDDSTGLCDCFEGHTGEACEEQTVFF